jgi:hypothetical protein
MSMGEREGLALGGASVAALVGSGGGLGAGGGGSGLALGGGAVITDGAGSATLATGGGGGATGSRGCAGALEHADAAMLSEPAISKTAFALRRVIDEGSTPARGVVASRSRSTRERVASRA